MRFLASRPATQPPSLLPLNWARGKSAAPSNARPTALHAKLGAKPPDTLSPTEARKQPSPADAVMALLKARSKSAAPEVVGNVANRTVPGPGGQIPVRIYTPAGNGPFPLIFYIHGGGWVIANLDTYDASARGLTNAAQAVVVSTHYRQAPEDKFPAAHEDVWASYQWAVANAPSINADPARVAVAGESAGGNLAANVAIRARDEKRRCRATSCSSIPSPRTT